MKNFFDVVAPIYENLHFGGKKTSDKIKSIVIFEPQDNIVDLGGGTGRTAKYFANKVQKVTVVDASGGMIRQCLQRHPELSCVHAEAQNLPFADDSVSKIIIVDAFHHFQNQKQVIKEIKRVLNKNGKVIIEEFNPAKIFGKLIVIIEKMFCLGSHFHSPTSLMNLFSMNGFKARIVNENKSTYYLVAEKTTNNL